MHDALKDKLRALPKQPGCYVLKDNMGHIIYVGKAKVLAHRVRSYFTAAAKRDERIEGLLRQVHDLEVFVMPSETEALLQEYRLIKQHKPWFNAQLKRDTPHPFLRIDTASAYPSMAIAETTAEDGAMYIGRFFDVYDAQEIIEKLNTVWHTPLCRKAILPERACLYRDLGKCSAPCEAAIAADAYQAVVGEVAALLQGERVPTMDRLHAQIGAHIRDLAFEKAAEAQKKLSTLEKLQRRGQKFFHLRPDQEAVLLLRAYHARECVVCHIQGGAVVHRTYLHADMQEAERRKAVADCLMSDATAPVEGWLTDCVIEVLADKRFVPLDAAQENGERCAAVLGALADFLM